MSIRSVTSTTEERKLSKSMEEPVEVAETRTFGSISLSVYTSYFAAGGSRCKFFVLIFMCILTQVLTSGGDYWVAIWYFIF